MKFLVWEMFPVIRKHGFVIRQISILLSLFLIVSNGRAQVLSQVPSLVGQSMALDDGASTSG